MGREGIRPETFGGIQGIISITSDFILFGSMAHIRPFLKSENTLPIKVSGVFMEP